MNNYKSSMLAGKISNPSKLYRIYKRSSYIKSLSEKYMVYDAG
jgi:hypothetical protein